MPNEPVPGLLLAGMDPGWARALAPVESTIAAMGDFLRAETAAGREYQPSEENVLRAFRLPLADVRVLIVGQDPYPTPGYPIGLSFAVERDLHIVPDSLKNIYRELHDDLGLVTPGHGDLTSWASNGVMLLNRVLTVEPGKSDSHKGRGWEAVTEAAIRALAARGTPLVAILWGKQAQSLRPLLGGTPIIESPHPSPISSWRGFFGSKPFSRANALLVSQGAQPVDWSIQ